MASIAGAEARSTRSASTPSALLMSVGDLLIGYLLLRQAAVAQAALDAGAPPRDVDFYAGKLAVAHWFARNVLPELTARRAVVENADTLVDGGARGGVLSVPPGWPTASPVIGRMTAEP